MSQDPPPSQEQDEQDQADHSGRFGEGRTPETLGDPPTDANSLSPFTDYEGLHEIETLDSTNLNTLPSVSSLSRPSPNEPPSYGPPSNRPPPNINVTSETPPTFQLYQTAPLQAPLELDSSFHDLKVGNLNLNTLSSTSSPNGPPPNINISPKAPPTLQLPRGGLQRSPNRGSPNRYSPYESQPYGPESCGPEPYGPQPYEPPLFEPQSYGPQPYEPQPFGPQPYGPHLLGPQLIEPQLIEPQPYEPQPYGSQPYGSKPYGPQPYAPQPYEPQPYEPQPYGSQPYGPQLHAPQPYEPQHYGPPLIRSPEAQPMLQYYQAPLQAPFTLLSPEQALRKLDALGPLSNPDVVDWAKQVRSWCTNNGKRGEGSTNKEIFCERVLCCKPGDLNFEGVKEWQQFPPGQRKMFRRFYNWMYNFSEEERRWVSRMDLRHLDGFKIEEKKVERPRGRRRGRPRGS